MKSDDKWFAKNFPSATARIEADKAIDALDVKEPMWRYLDVWIAAYKAAGGKTWVVP